MTKDWRFHGRAAQIAQLDRWLGPRRFHSIAYFGRRGIGKVELVKETVRRRNATARTLFLEFAPNSSGRAELGRLHDAVREQGLLAMLEGWDASGAERVSAAFAVEEAVDYLLRQNLTVVIDEFQNVDGHPGMASGFKQIIDRLGSAGQPGPGKLVLVGSDQQGMARLFSDDRQPFYRRATVRRLKSWNVAETMEMAADQGWLDLPGRFLTLWTAFGPVPRYWEEFHRTGPATLDTWRNDDRWRAEFMEWALDTADSDWSDHMHSWTRDELSEGNFAVLRALAQGRRRGRTAAELHGGIDQAVGDSQKRLESLGRMGMTIRIQPIWDSPENPKQEPWRVNDNFVLFWNGVLGPALHSLERGAVREEVRVEAERRLATHEGHALEGLARAATRERWEREGVLRHRLEHGFVLEQHSSGRRETVAEFDMLGYTQPREDGPFACWVGSCKRGPERHDLKRHLQEPLQRARQSQPPESVRQWLDSRCIGLLVSPEFTAAQRARLESAPKPVGFSRIECLDILDLAAGLGIDLRPALAPANPSPKPDLDSDFSP